MKTLNPKTRRTISRQLGILFENDKILANEVKALIEGVVPITTRKVDDQLATNLLVSLKNYNAQFKLNAFPS